ncbi:ATP10 [Candida theae]|uniref:ATP10 n=1 Tax=Candida theae TaxID=1198502 RepID=A0AAD5BHP5_9ASCO|nr:ATP10 [Candida theae]KAI5964411.1 ATP10 [Candida theae]
MSSCPRLITRQLSTSAHLLQQRSQPRFVDTIKEVSKPAQEDSYNVTRPLGLTKPVLLNHKLSDTYSFSNIVGELFGAQAKERRQKNLDFDLKHSPIYDMKSFQNTKGKIFKPPISWFKQDKSLYFPDFIAKTLTGESNSLYDVLNNKYSIVRLYSTVIGEQCSRSYFKVDNEDYYSTNYKSFVEKFPNFQIIDINMPSSWIKGFVLNLSLSNLRKMISPERYQNYFILPLHILAPEIREQLHCDNQCTGYIYIIDSFGKIRWATSGYSTPEDLQLMWKVVKGLEKEATQKVKRV